MPIKTCPKCKKEFEYEKHVCPHCGYDLWEQADFLKMFISDPRYRQAMYYLSGFFAIAVAINIGLWWLKTVFPDIGQHVDTTYLKFLYNVTGTITDYALPVFILAVMILSFMGKKATEITSPSSQTSVTSSSPSPIASKPDHKIIWVFAVYSVLCLILVLVLVFVTATSEDNMNSNQPTAKITDFVSCAAAGNPIMESYPRQCRANGQTFVEVINTNLNANTNTPGEPSCKNVCGDGVCQEIVCLAIGCPCAETVASCPQDCKIVPAGDTGVVSGTVTLGPTCPVQRIPPDPACADKPYQTTIQIIAIGSPLSSPFKVINSDVQGNYTVTLPEGDYNFQPQGGTMLPRCNNQDVTVTAGANLKVDFSCDTGIR